MVRFVGIDPSTKTGFVALDEDGGVLRRKELTGIGDKDPKRMASLIGEVMAFVQQGDVICIESPAVHAQGNAVGFMWGLAYGIRTAFFQRGIAYTDVAPTAVKKFATGKGNAKKEDMILPIHRKWGFEHGSDNVRDAFVLARIAMDMAYWKAGIGSGVKYEQEVIEAILNPPIKKPKRKKVAK